jgi:purine-nucleoside phosphorylase
MMAKSKPGSTTLNPATTARFLKRSLGIGGKTTNRQLGIILGSGFDSVLQEVTVAKRILFAKIPGFVKTAVRGHAGEVISGELGGIPIVVLSGRFHYYEGHSMDLVTFPVRVLASLGVTDLLLTSAAGGISRGFQTGTFMLFRDHINFMGTNPLRGYGGSENRFIDLSQTYDAKLGKLLKQSADSAKVDLKDGVYLAISGPSYETPSEIKAFRKWGADAVGMSTVPEAITARQCGLRVAAVSCITNAAAGINGEALSHDDVLFQAKSRGLAMQKLISRFVQLYAKDKQAGSR